MQNVLGILMHGNQVFESMILFVSLRKDAHAFIEKCQECQKFRLIHSFPLETQM